MTLHEHIRSLPVPPVLDVLGKFVHLRNARTGTTSMDEGPLRGRAIMRRRDRYLWETVWNNIIVPNKDVVIFTFVRNPWDRICSAFYHCRDRTKTPENKIDGRWEFASWVKEVLAVKGPGVNMHFAEQYPTAYFEDRPIGFIGRFEEMGRDWDKLATKILVACPLPHWNACGHGEYVDHYDEDTRQIVGELYQRDIRAFGYKFGE